MYDCMSASRKVSKTLTKEIHICTPRIALGNTSSGVTRNSVAPGQISKFIPPFPFHTLSPLPLTPSPYPLFPFPSLPGPSIPFLPLHVLPFFSSPSLLFPTLSFPFPLITARSLGSAIAPPAETGRRTHFCAIYSPKPTNC